LKRHQKTAAGVSGGIDMAVQLVAIEYGEDVAKSVQMLIEYDPHHLSTAAPLQRRRPPPSIARDRCCVTCTRADRGGGSTVNQGISVNY
jgi:transcriptional regulator GlxA family with amidase domain